MEKSAASLWFLEVVSVRALPSEGGPRIIILYKCRNLQTHCLHSVVSIWKKEKERDEDVRFILLEGNGHAFHLFALLIQVLIRFSSGLMTLDTLPSCQRSQSGSNPKSTKMRTVTVLPAAPMGPYFTPAPQVVSHHVPQMHRVMQPHMLPTPHRVVVQKAMAPVQITRHQGVESSEASNSFIFLDIACYSFMFSNAYAYILKIGALPLHVPLFSYFCLKAIKLPCGEFSYSAGELLADAPSGDVQMMQMPQGLMQHTPNRAVVQHPMQISRAPVHQGVELSEASN